MRHVTFSIVLLLAFGLRAAAQGGCISVVPTGGAQPDFVGAYKFALQCASEAYKGDDARFDTTLFPRYGQYSVYLGVGGARRGALVVPMLTDGALGQQALPALAWQEGDYAALQFKMAAAATVIFRSAELADGYSVSSGADFFVDACESYLFGRAMYRTAGEAELAEALAAADARLLVVPDFTRAHNDETFYAAAVAQKYPGLSATLRAFLRRGGTIYAEGNGGYLLQALGLLAEGTISYAAPVAVEGLAAVSAGGGWIATTTKATSGKMYLYRVPEVRLGAGAAPIATLGDVPVLFEQRAEGGRMVVCTGMPTFAGLQGLRASADEAEKQQSGRQLQWFLNVLLSANSYAVDAVHTVRNQIQAGVTAPPNAVAFDEADEFEVQVVVRNLSSESVAGVTLREVVVAELTPVVSGGLCGDFSARGDTLTATVNLAAHAEQRLRYYVQMPRPNTTPHDRLNDAVGQSGLLSVARSGVRYASAGQTSAYGREKAMAYAMLSADLYCDVDVNWKNPLGTYYQPFKVFMNMENKGRTAAKDVVYEQYVPIDLPVYWVDGAINIPILKTAGGKYVDVLRGVTAVRDSGLSAAELRGHDMDLDGKPDVWLDQRSIYPKGYSLRDTLIYWRNAWDHFRGKPWLPKEQQRPCAPDSVYWFEDIDHDSIYTCVRPDGTRYGYDARTGGEVAEDEGDRLRAWQLRWNIGEVPGLQTFEPFMSYELWIDVPNLPNMAAGVAKAYGRMLKTDRQGAEAKDGTDYYYFPYHSAGGSIPGDVGAIRSACPECDKRWQYWMEADTSGAPVWKRFVHTQRHDYMGYKWVDDGDSIHSAIYNGSGKPYEELYGTTPVPRDAFNLVVLLGGEDIDMSKFHSTRTQPTRIRYKSIFDEQKTLGMRTIYTFYAPLPNPLQLAYLSNGYEISDPATGKILETLPYKGRVNVDFYMSAATEYSYYWIRSAGTQAGVGNGGSVAYTPNANTWKYDYSKYVDGAAELGDGVVGYLVYEIPKGMGGYRMELPRVNPDDPNSPFDVDKIVQLKAPRAADNSAAAGAEQGRQRFRQMRGAMKYAPWEAIHHNANTPDTIAIYDDGVKYSIWIPQLLIPAALDDDDSDGADDWIDDEGDRFYNADNQSYLEDVVPRGTGYEIEARNPSDTAGCHHSDGDMGYSPRGWCAGGDGRFGDDEFEELGRVYFKIAAQYVGRGKEGPVSISRGGVLVCEEIFGGSPWVIYAHTLSGWANGTDIQLKTEPLPYNVRFGEDTILLRNTITDASELTHLTERNPDGTYSNLLVTNNPAHYFGDSFDPFHLTRCADSGTVTITTYVGGKDPCSLIEPAENISLSAIVNPAVKKQVTLVPLAAGNAALSALGYPKTLAEKALVQVKVEFTNSSALDWRNIRLQTLVADSLKDDIRVEMEYVASPRPLVPGDNIGQLTAGWRFNEPDGEVLVGLGNVLPLLQPPRRGYYLVLLSISDRLKDGIYEVNFSLDADACRPDKAVAGTVRHSAPRALISVQRGAAHNPMVLGTAQLDSLVIAPQSSDIYRPLGDVKWQRIRGGESPVNTLAGYDSLANTLPALRGANSVVDLTPAGTFPTTACKRLLVVEKAALRCVDASSGEARITAGQRLHYADSNGALQNVSSPAVSVSTRGPKVVLAKEIVAVNGSPYAAGDVLSADADGRAEVAVKVTANNRGLAADNVRATYANDGTFAPVADKIAAECPACVVRGSSVEVNFGTMLSGSERSITLYYAVDTAELFGAADATAVQQRSAGAPDEKSGAPQGKLAVIGSGNVEFTSAAGNLRYGYADREPARAPFYEVAPVAFAVADGSATIGIGRPVTFTATVRSYAYPVRNLPVCLYAVSGADTTLLATAVIEAIDTLGTAVVAMQHTFADARAALDGRLRLLFKVNADAALPELVYANNSAFFDAPAVPNIEPDDGKLVITPNPASGGQTTLIYADCIVPVRSITACLYRATGGKLACHSATQCQTTWPLRAVRPGLYAARIEVVLADGTVKRYLRRLVVDD